MARATLFQLLLQCVPAEQTFNVPNVIMENSQQLPPSHFNLNLLSQFYTGWVSHVASLMKKTALAEPFPVPEVEVIFSLPPIKVTFSSFPLSSRSTPFQLLCC